MGSGTGVGHSNIREEKIIQLRKVDIHNVYEPENTVSKALYHSFGFRENGEMDGDEIVAVLKL